MLRKAKKSDIPFIYPLIKIIWEDMAFPLLQLVDESTFQQLMLQSLSQPNSKFSYTNAYVYTIDDVVCGVLYYYHGKKELAYNQQFEQFITSQLANIDVSALFSEREANDEELYIDSLVVSYLYRNQGIGTSLLQEFLTLHANHHLPITLNCDLLNPKAKRLYENLGFQTSHRLSFLGHDYYHMTYMKN